MVSHLIRITFKILYIFWKILQVLTTVYFSDVIPYFVSFYSLYIPAQWTSFYALILYLDV